MVSWFPYFLQEVAHFDTRPACGILNSMHELPITESIVEIAVRYGKEAKAKRVTDLYLIIGQLATVVDESVQFYWDIISKDTICEGARLHFERIPAQLLCLDCNIPYNIEHGGMTTCPQCDGIRVKVTQGEEFRLDSINIED